jgi:hypothetical protein
MGSIQDAMKDQPFPELENLRRKLDLLSTVIKEEFGILTWYESVLNRISRYLPTRNKP